MSPAGAEAALAALPSSPDPSVESGLALSLSPAGNNSSTDELPPSTISTSITPFSASIEPTASGSQAAASSGSSDASGSSTRICPGMQADAGVSTAVVNTSVEPPPGSR